MVTCGKHGSHVFLFLALLLWVKCVLKKMRGKIFEVSDTLSVFVQPSD